MAVKDVFRPSSTNPTDPSTKEKDDGKESEWQRKAKDAKAEREYLEEQRRIDRIGQPAEPSKPPESPVKVTGEVSLGNIDFQQEREEATAELRRLKQEADEAGKGLAQENMQLREKIHEQQNKVLEITLQAQIQELTRMIQSNAPQKNIAEQIKEAEETGALLGLARPSPQTSDIQASLALKKLDFEQTVELRRLAKEERAEGRRWQLELRRMDDERDARRQEEERQRKRDEMFAKAPTMIGGALPKGIIETEASKPSGAPAGRTKHHIEAPVGEGGEVQCSECGQPVTIGPTARSAVCANCETKYSIKRTEKIEPEEE